jgi:septal ring factor EnvC (AmiA/AmiB activator)
MNTGTMDAIDQIEKKHDVLESQVKSLTKEVKVSDTKATSALNGSDRIKSSMEALTKRVASLENKK